jgi:acetyl-CoA carboxylase carboxyltransferase component
MAGGRSYHTEASWIWPTAEISAMGAEGSVDVAFHRDYESAEDPAVRRQEMIDEFYKQMTAVRAASGFGIDDAIDPAETRLRIAAVLRGQVARRRPNLPPKLHPIDPL